MQIAIIGANFTPNEVDALRRSLATFRHVRHHFLHFANGFWKECERMDIPRNLRNIASAKSKGSARMDFWKHMPSHSPNLVYVSAWIKCRYPDVFCTALLNSQPMGFYAPAQLVRDAREHGLEVRRIDVNQ